MQLSLRFLQRSLTPRPPLGYPLFPAPRMIVLGCEVEPAPGVHCLLNWTAADVARIRPLALAAAFPDFAALAAMVHRGELALPDLQYPLLVFSRPGEGALTQEQHDELWGWFGLPYLEQIRDGDGRLLAQECEARDGFHLTADAGTMELEGRLLQAPCECGQISPRVHIAPSLAFAAQAGD